MRKTVYDFSGQTAVVTGASAGIGKAAAEAFAAGKARVFLLDIDEEKARLQKEVAKMESSKKKARNSGQKKPKKWPGKLGIR